MVTFAFILVFILLGQVIFVLDIYLFDISYYEAFLNVFYSQGTADRQILIFSVIFGLVWSIVTDFRRRKKQQESKPKA